MTDPERWLRAALRLPEQASSVAPEIDHLHYAVISVSFAGAFLVALATSWFVLRYREGAKPSARPMSGRSKPNRNAVPTTRLKKPATMPMAM